MITTQNRYSFTVLRDTDFAERFEFVNDDNTKCDFSGYSARMEILPSSVSGSAILTLTSNLMSDGTGIDLTPTTGSSSLPYSSGSLAILISSASGSALNDYDRLYYFLDMTRTVSNATFRLMEGRIKVG